jgi:outer membrane receptor protein involved in Fe transport
MIRNSEVTLAVQRALAMSAVAAIGATTLPAPAQAQEAAAAGTEAVQTVTVTGSRIRRVDAETANPVITIDNTQIQQSGARTVGDLIMQLPTVNGAATNPSVNNGGGFGESYIELRGLDAKRTLILLDGRRIGLIGDPGSGTSAVDVNQIPLAIIDHVEVLKEGAGAVYGSDAIAGVVNFITRKDVQGAEVSANYGKTTANDGANREIDLTVGDQTDKFSFMLSGRYQVQNPVLEGNREFSKFALYNSSNSIYKGGSSRTPTGRIFLPSTFPDATLAACDSGSVTKITGAPNSSLANYRCFNDGGANDDHYNYAPLNYLVTPQERGSVFSKFNYKINDNFETYGSVLYNRTHSGFQEAALPFDSVDDNVVISNASIYNPFGISFGGNSGVNPDAEWRLVGLGPRNSDTTSNTIEGTWGFKGNIADSGWTWDLNGTYGRLDQHALIQGYFFASGLQNALGPSFIGANGPECGTAANPIPGCVPIDIFSVNDSAVSTPADQAAFKAISTGYNTEHTYVFKDVALNFGGKVFTLPAGDVQASVGVEHMWQEGIFQADQIVIAQPPLYNTCEISQEACTGDTRGHYSNTDFYAEVFIPLVKDVPLVHSLNLDLGGRYSDYSIFENTTRGTFKVEYRPITDLLIRATYAQVYRAPTIDDIAAAPKINNPTFIDPCNGLTAAKVAAEPGLANACQGVPLDGTFKEANGQITALLQSNPDVKPETGDVITAGFVYDPSFLSGFSFNADYWNYTIDEVITQLDPNYSIDQCIAGGAYYCGLVHRFTSGAESGQILLFEQPTANAGTLKTDGIDFGFKYNIRFEKAGSFRFSIDMTHVNSYTNTPLGGTAVEYAGTYNKQFGNDTKWRGFASLAWAMKGFDALITEQYIGGLILPNGSPGSTNTVITIPDVFYTNMTLGYNFPTNTRIQAGIINAFNRVPPIFYQNNVINANTDVSTYDTLGRRWFVGITQKF